MESRRDAHLLSPAVSSSRLSAPCLLFLWSLVPGWAGAQEPACESGVGVGFSLSSIESDVPFEGVIGTAGGDEVILEAPPGTTSGSTRIYVDLVSVLEASGINGWSFGIAFDGDLDLLSLTQVFPPRPPVSCPQIGATDPCCSRTYPRIVDPAENQGQRGIVDAHALTVACDSDVPAEGPLPPVGTQSLFGIEIGWSGGPLPAGGRSATLRFLEGLVGPEGPISNLVTVGGGSVDACNFDVASITVRFVEAPVTRFVRGNANGDFKVDIADAIWMLNDLFLGGPTTPCMDAADANGDGELVISDPIYLLNGQFAGGQLPPAPFPDCGTDPSGEPGPLGCESSPCP